jgi:HNH endonuclease
MLNEPMPVWRKAQKQHKCQSCSKVIAYGEDYLDKALREPAHSHLRYCRGCAEPVVRRAIEDGMSSNGGGVARVNSRNDFPDRYQQRISSAAWKTLKRKVIEQRGNRCERCEKESASLELHHLHYQSLGSEQPEDVALLCAECHNEAHQRATTTWSKPKDEGWIVG